MEMGEQYFVTDSKQGNHEYAKKGTEIDEQRDGKTIYFTECTSCRSGSL